MNFLRYRKFYFTFSAALILGSLVCLAFFALKPGIDFTGGSILEVEYKDTRPSIEEVKNSLNEIDLGEVIVQPFGEKGMLLRLKDINEETHQNILQKLRQGQTSSKFQDLEEQRFESIGPVIGQELKQKTKLLIGLSLLAIVLYIAMAFRKVQRPFRSWQFSIASLIALFHDVLIPVGVFSVLGKYQGVEISIPVIVALLTVLGYSINDTVVVFDRIRENLFKNAGLGLEEIVDRSLNETLVRSINTSLTTLFVLFAIFFFGGVTLKYFALALIIGVSAGTYSSIFLASPILVWWLKRREQ